MASGDGCLSDFLRDGNGLALGIRSQPDGGGLVWRGGSSLWSPLSFGTRSSIWRWGAADKREVRVARVNGNDVRRRKLGFAWEEIDA